MLIAFDQCTEFSKIQKKSLLDGVDMDSRITEIHERIEPIISNILVQVRTQKNVDKVAVTQLYALLDELAPYAQKEIYIPRKLVGRLILLYSAMVTQAKFASDPLELSRESEKLLGHMHLIYNAPFKEIRH